MRRWMTLGLALVFVVGCSEGTPTEPEASPTAGVTAANSPAAAASAHTRFTVPFFFGESCNGEAVEGETTWHSFTNSKETPKDRVHFNTHFDLRGEGVGQASGAKYRYSSQSNQTFNVAEDNFPATVRFRQTLRVIAQGNLPDRKVDAVGKATFTASGEIIHNEVEFEEDCS